MPEPITTLTVGAIALYLAEKARNKVIDKSTEALWESVKNLFKGEKIVSILEENPDSFTEQEKLAFKLDELIRERPATLGEIEDLLKQLPHAKVTSAATATGIGNLLFQNISNSTINASITIGKSGEYRELKDQLNTLQKLLDRTPETEFQERLVLSEKINKQRDFLEEFKQDVRMLAEEFDKTELNTESLQKAKEYFDKGEITEARLEYYSCFISFTEKDDAFSERLYNDMQGKGIRCWRWKEDAKWGRTLRKEIDEAVRDFEKLVVICSKDSLNAPAVLEEIERALDKEDMLRRAGDEGEVLFPIRIDDYIFDGWGNELKIRLTKKNIGDFRDWNTDPEKYQKSVDRLVKNLNRLSVVS